MTQADTLSPAQRAVLTAIKSAGAVRVDARGLRALARQLSLSVHEIDSALDELVLCRQLVAVGDDNFARLISHHSEAG